MGSSADPHLSDPSEVGSRLWWTCRRRAVLLLSAATLGIALTASAVFLRATATPSYTATATIVANSLAHDPAGLPRLATAVASDQQVLRAAILDTGLDFASTTEFQKSYAIRPVEENVIILVDGIARNPDDAVTIANSLADELTAKLNETGSEVGRFQVLSRAVTALPNPIRTTLIIGSAAGFWAPSRRYSGSRACSQQPGDR